MRRIELYENIVLKDGRSGTVIDVYETNGRQDGFLVDVGLPPENGEDILAERKDIADDATPRKRICRGARRKPRDT